ncbi:MAG: hypothetical protein GY820_43885, partial [Gammaproteobacteria bacterium]|nr:hypothetical protein [Gammaproteobacteria bacterium]
MTAEEQRDIRAMQREVTRATEEATQARETAVRERQRADELATELQQLRASRAPQQPTVIRDEDPDPMRGGTRLASFTGRYEANRTFADFLQRFEEHARARNWQGDRRADILPTYLDGQALMAYRLLPDEVKSSWEATKRELTTSLQPFENEAYCAGKLHAPRTQGPTEDVSTYAASIESLTRGAYPVKDAFPLTAQDLQMKNCFITGLSTEVKAAVLAKKPATYQEALQEALTKEAQNDLIAGCTRPGTAPEPAKLFATSASYGMTGSCVKNDDVLNECYSVNVNRNHEQPLNVQQGNGTFGSEYVGNNVPFPSSNSRNNQRLVCYYCSKRGHFQAVCRSRLRDMAMMHPQNA